MKREKYTLALRHSLDLAGPRDARPLALLLRARDEIRALLAEGCDPTSETGQTDTPLTREIGRVLGERE